MFDLSLAHISNEEHERDLAADLRDRQVLKATTAETAVTAETADIAPAPDRTPVERPVARRQVTGVRAVGRQG